MTMSSPVRRRASAESGMACSYGRFYCNKMEAALHKCSTQLTMSQTVTHICKTKCSSLLGCGAEQFPVFQKCYTP
jgi:hypothetical protein